MEAWFKQMASAVGLGLEAGSAFIIAFGALEAMYGSIRAVIGGHTKRGQRKDVWLRFAVWLLLGLEFELAADIVRTAVAPNWTDIGQLAAIGMIRTFLNFFLEKDLESYEPKDRNRVTEGVA